MERQMEVRLNDKIDKQTDDSKEKVEDIKDIFVDGFKLFAECMESLCNTLKRKVEEQAEDIASLKRKLNKMDNKLDAVLKRLSR